MEEKQACEQICHNFARSKCVFEPFPLFGFVCFFKGMRNRVGQISSWQVFTDPLKTLYQARPQWPKAAACLCVTV